MLYNIQIVFFLLDFVHHVTDKQTLKYYVSEAGSASVFTRETLNLLDPSYPAIPIA